MRVFIAVDLPRRIEAALMEIPAVVDPDLRLARWVRPGAVHVTLKFLGEVPENGVPAIVQTLSSIETAPIGIRVSGLGFFPNRRAPRVLWAGVESDGLAELADRVDVSLEALGFPAGRRAFRPHVTLARSPGRGTIATALIRRLGAFDRSEFGEFASRRLFVYRSRLGKGGSVHEKQAEVVFAGE